MQAIKTHFVAKSGNRKIGIMSTTYRDRQSCPTSCPLLLGGCYAAGRIENVAIKFGFPGATWVELAVQNTPRGGAFRHLTVGDLLGLDGKIDRVFTGGIERLVRERPDITLHIVYTHAFDDPEVAEWIRYMFATYGVVINASCQTEADVRRALALGLHPVLIASGDDDPLLGTFIEERRVLVCPAQTRGVTCAECKLCGKGDRADGAWLRPVIAFLPHGSGKKLAAATASRVGPQK